MKETDLLQRWEQECNIYRAWGDSVRDTIVSEVEKSFQCQSRDVLKIPIVPRLKDTQKLIEKAFSRGKNYDSPYENITDKVGIRLVVLTTKEVEIICNCIEKIDCWSFSKDRDFEKEKELRPELFDYQSNHYVVYPSVPIYLDDISIPINTPCEIQVRSLLQHAWAEMTHDTVYKPNTVEASPETKRLCARAIALAEVVDEIFCRVADSVQVASIAVEGVVMSLGQLYTKYVEISPSVGNLNMFIIDAYSEVLDADITSKVSQFFEERKELAELIQKRARSNVLFQQPAILLVYYLVTKRKSKTKTLWPLLPEELHPIYTDLGISFS
jgi:ppGpp synthetase/RelA/SpoT-type nucleotidyltranferase